MVASVPYNSLVSFKKLHIYDLCTVMHTIDDDQGDRGETVNQNIICSQVGQIGLRTFHLHARDGRFFYSWSLLWGFAPNDYLYDYMNMVMVMIMMVRVMQKGGST